MGYEWRGFWVAAIRETFEESGLLLAYDQHGELFLSKRLSLKDDFHPTGSLYDGQISLLDVCETEGIKLAVDRSIFTIDLSRRLVGLAASIQGSLLRRRPRLNVVFTTSKRPWIAYG